VAKTAAVKSSSRGIATYRQMDGIGHAAAQSSIWMQSQSNSRQQLSHRRIHASPAAAAATASGSAKRLGFVSLCVPYTEASQRDANLTDAEPSPTLAADCGRFVTDSLTIVNKTYRRDDQPQPGHGHGRRPAG